MLFCLLLANSVMISFSYSQSGSAFIPFESIAQSKIVQYSKPISIDEALLRINGENGQSPKRSLSRNELNGEYFERDGYVINVKSRLNTKSLSLEMLSRMQKSLEVSYKQMNSLYHNTLREINNYSVLVSYLKDSNQKNCFIMDNSGRYYVVITIYSKQDSAEIKKAEAFVDTLVNSITFK